MKQKIAVAVLAVALVLSLGLTALFMLRIHRISEWHDVLQAEADDLFRESEDLRLELQERQNKIDELAQDIFNLIVSEQHTMYELQREVGDLQRKINELQAEEPFWHGLTPTFVRQQFLENFANDYIDTSSIGDIPWNWVFSEWRVHVGSYYVLVDFDAGILLFSYHVTWPPPRQISHWTLVGFDIWGGDFTLAPPPRERRSFTFDQVRRTYADSDMTALRFYYADWSDGVNILHPYREMDVQLHYVWVEMIQQTQIWDLWFEGEKLYVDMLPGHYLSFVTGTMSVAFGLHPLLKTLTHNFPYAREIKITFGGRHMPLDHHGSVYGVYTVGVGFMETEMFRYGWGGWHTRMHD